MFTTAYRYLVQILPSLIIAPLYFAKKVELGTITQSYGAFNHILGDFSIIINQFEALSSFSAGLTRLNDFIERINSTKIGTRHFSYQYIFLTTICPSKPKFANKKAAQLEWSLSEQSLHPPNPTLLCVA